MSVTMYPLSLEERNGMLQIYSDCYKDAYGFRPRYNYHVMSDEYLVNQFEIFKAEAERYHKERQYIIAEAEKEFEMLIVKTIELGAGDRKTAIRWIVDSENEWDAEHIVWGYELLGTDYGTKLQKEIEGCCDDILQRAWES